MTATENTTPAGAGLFLVRAYGSGYFTINEHRYESGVVVAAGQPPLRWGINDVSELAGVRLDDVFALAPDLVLLGTGTSQHFPNPDFYAEFAARRIALECMSTPAAVRTYNIVAEEGRRVVALLMPVR